MNEKKTLRKQTKLLRKGKKTFTHLNLNNELERNIQ
jgi:hypothetical protein